MPDQPLPEMFNSPALPIVALGLVAAAYFIPGLINGVRIARTGAAGPLLDSIRRTLWIPSIVMLFIELARRHETHPPDLLMLALGLEVAGGILLAAQLLLRSRRRRVIETLIPSQSSRAMIRLISDRRWLETTCLADVALAHPNPLPDVQLLATLAYLVVGRKGDALRTLKSIDTARLNGPMKRLAWWVRITMRVPIRDPLANTMGGNVFYPAAFCLAVALGLVTDASTAVAGRPAAVGLLLYGIYFASRSVFAFLGRIRCRRVAPVVYEVAEGLMREGRFQETGAVCEGRVRMNASDVRARLLAASALCEAGDFKRAGAHLAALPAGSDPGIEISRGSLQARIEAAGATARG